MKIEMSVRYNKTDIAAMIMENHVKLYGSAPAGMMWECDDMYSWECTVRAVEIPTPEEVKEQEQEQKAEI
jgi:hypothetical protein